MTGKLFRRDGERLPLCSAASPDAGAGDQALAVVIVGAAGVEPASSRFTAESSTSERLLP
jgi:hypothetical protein